MEYTFVILKPDAVGRALTGKIIQKFEDAGLEICGLNHIARADEKMLRRHYNKDDAWKIKIGGYVKTDVQKMNFDPIEFLGTADEKTIGQGVVDKLVDYMQAGPIITIILKGYDAVNTVRKLVGNTYPNEADPSTIRGTYGNDTKMASALERRSVINLVHASGEVQEARDEISLWMPDFDITGGSCEHSDRASGCCGGGNCGSF